jgi:ABC-type amino acid transport substrate-binding protein
MDHARPFRMHFSARVGALFALALALCWQPAAAQVPIRVAAPNGTESYAPLIDAVYATLGYTPVYTFMPLERALVEANAGKNFDAHIGVVPSMMANYPNLVQTTEPVTVLFIQAWIRKGAHITIKTALDLRRHKIGMLRGSKATETFARDFHIDAQLANSGDSLAAMLAADRFDVVLVASAFKQARLNEVAVLAAPNLAHFDAFHLFNKSHADLVPRWDQALKSMKADGRFQTLSQKK